MELPVEPIPSELKPQDKRLSKLKYQLPKLPATMMVLGSCGSGKSSVLWSLLTEGYTYKGKSIFDEGIIYLGSMDSITTFEKLPIKNKIILTEFDPADFEAYLDDLKTHQLERLAKNKRPLNIVIIFDDFAGQNLMKRNGTKGSPLERLTLTSRHECNATIIYLSQAYKNTGFSHPVVRNNITTFILAQMKRPEVEKVADEISGDMTKDEFIDTYDKVMSHRPFNFMTFDTRRPLDQRWTERFATPIPRPQRLLAINRDDAQTPKEFDGRRPDIPDAKP